MNVTKLMEYTENINLTDSSSPTMRFTFSFLDVLLFNFSDEPSS